MIRNNTADSTHHKAREYTEKEKKTKQTKNLSNITSGIEKKKTKTNNTKQKQNIKTQPKPKEIIKFPRQISFGILYRGGILVCGRPEEHSSKV